MFVVILDENSLNPDINKKEILMAGIKKNDACILDCFNKLGFTKTYDEFLNNIIDWFIDNSEKEQRLMEWYKKDPPNFLFYALDFLISDFNNGFNGLVNQVPIETYTHYTTEAVGELVVNDLSLIRPKYIVVYTTSSSKLESINYDFKWDFDHKGSVISNIKILGQGFYNIAFQVTFDNGKLYCLRFRKSNNHNWYNDTSYDIGTLLARSDNSGFVKPFHVEKLFSGKKNEFVLYINPILRPIENIETEIPKVAVCMIKALRFMHSNRLFYADFFNIDNFMLDDNANIVISDTDMYKNRSYLTPNELIELGSIQSHEQKNIIDIINKGYDLNENDTIHGICKIRYYCALLTERLHNNNQATSEYHQYVTTCLIARMFMYFLINKEIKDNIDITVQINRNVVENMNKLKSLNPVDVIKTSNMSDNDYASIISSCGDDNYDESYANLPDDWYINPAGVIKTSNMSDDDYASFASSGDDDHDESYANLPDSWVFNLTGN